MCFEYASPSENLPEALNAKFKFTHREPQWSL